MPSRIITTEYEREQAIAWLKNQKLPFTIDVSQGKRRSVEQNRLQRQWCNEIAEQRGDVTPEEVRGECKLTVGVPILRAENLAFCERYDEHIKPLPYETKIACMMEPLDFPVTRLMNTKQKTAYLDAVYKHYSEQGIVLTLPADRHAA